MAILDYLKRILHAKAVDESSEGDREETALQMIAEHYRQYMYEVAFLISKDKLLADDIVQEVMLKFAVNPGVLRDFTISVTNEAELKKNAKWLWTVIEHHYIDQWRKREKTRLVSLDDPETNIELPDTADSPYEEAIGKELHELIEFYFASQHSVNSEAVRLRILRQLSYNEIARLLGITTNAAKLRYARGVDSLKEWLKRHGVEVIYQAESRVYRVAASRRREVSDRSVSEGSSEHER